MSKFVSFPSFKLWLVYAYILSNFSLYMLIKIICLWKRVFDSFLSCYMNGRSFLLFHCIFLLLSVLEFLLFIQKCLWFLIFGVFLSYPKVVVVVKVNLYQDLRHYSNLTFKAPFILWGWRLNVKLIKTLPEFQNTLMRTRFSWHLLVQSQQWKDQNNGKSVQS